MKSYRSWNRNPDANQSIMAPFWRCDSPVFDPSQSYLPRGKGRSYGDVCLNDGGWLIDIKNLTHILGFNRETGILKAEAGLSLAEIIDLFLPQGWFLPVSPGTKYVTLGGAIANDVHGKNHHVSGTFGCHVLRFELMRSDGEVLLCSPFENTELFKATIGGLGLTGLIGWAEIQLKPVKSPFMNVENIKFCDLDEFFKISEASNSNFEYTAAWLDCMADDPGRGIFMRGNHSSPPDADFSAIKKRISLSVPFELPVNILNASFVKLFNHFYYNRQIEQKLSKQVDYDSFFYPLDGVRDWNRFYGPKGFYQHQAVIPFEKKEALHEMFAQFKSFGQGSYFAVLKAFGGKISPGLLSFPTAGITAALDFPNKGDRTLELLNKLDDITIKAGGRVNPSKDARMSSRCFKESYPDWSALEKCRDPQFSSSFWRRVTEGTSE